MIVGAMQKAAAAGKAITSASVAAQLNTLDSDTAGGLLAPLSYPQDHSQFANCYAYEQVQNGKWTRTVRHRRQPVRVQERAQALAERPPAGSRARRRISP